MSAPQTLPAAIAGIPPSLAARLPGFADFGISLDRLIAAVREAGPERGPATPGWPEAMMAHGQAFMAAGEAAEQRGEADAAKAAFLEASFWFFFARFPHIMNAGGAAAYRLHNAAYHRAAAHFRAPVEIVRIPCNGGGCPVLLRLPHGVQAPVPLVIVSGGSDVWKSDLEVHSMSEACLRRGMATLALDVPGTGECPIPLSPDAIGVHAAVLRWAREDRRIDAARIGVYAISVGGYFAVQLALREPSLGGVVQVGGPVHHAFLPGNFAHLPPYIHAAFARMLGLGGATDAGLLAERMAGLSLSALGLLPAHAHAPLLSINGDADELVPIGEFQYLTSQGVRHDTLIFAGDRHVASRNWRLHEGFAADWLAQHLGPPALTPPPPPSARPHRSP